MGRFSDRDELRAFIDRYCSRCQHAKRNYVDDRFPCAVWHVHRVYDPENEEIKSIQNVLIPVDQNGVNQECSMFWGIPEPEMQPDEMERRLDPDL